MVEKQKKTEEGFQNFCGGITCGDMVRKMLEAEKSGRPFNCAEMMSQMMKMCGGFTKKGKGVRPRYPVVLPSHPFCHFRPLRASGRKRFFPAAVSSHRRSLPALSSLPFFRLLH